MEATASSGIPLPSRRVATPSLGWRFPLEQAGRFARRCASFGRNQLLDIKYTGRPIGVTRKTRFGSLGAHDSAYSDYRALEAIFAGRVSEGDVLVDIGCGAGRVLGLWSHHWPDNKVIGIELDPLVAAEARRRFRGKPLVQVIEGDAVDNLPSDGTFFYLYNPFGAEVLRRLREALAQEAGSRRLVRVVYHIPMHLSVFEEDPRWSIEEIPIPGPERAVLLRLAPPLENPG